MTLAASAIACYITHWHSMCCIAPSYHIATPASAEFAIYY